MPASPHQPIVALHAAVDAAAHPLAAHHGGALVCARGCVDCCIDGLTVLSVEAELIGARHGELLASAAPHPPGRCAMLGPAGDCRIYPDRPYVCRTQGLPLRWLDTAADGRVVEQRDICERNDLGAALLALGPEACWTIGPFEARLRALEQRRSGGKPARVALRALFDGG